MTPRPVRPPENEHLDQARTSLHQLGTGRVSQALALATTAWHLWGQANRLYKGARFARSYQLTVWEGDRLWLPAQAWLLSVLPAGRQRALSVRTTADRAAIASNTDQRSLWTLRTLYDGGVQQRLRIDGHSVLVSIEKDHAGPAQLQQHDGPVLSPARLVFRCQDTTGRQAVLAHLQRLADEECERRATVPVLWTPSRWGSDWNRVGDLTTRDLASVVLPAGDAEDLMADVQAFLAREATYLRVGAPWHRGYLFHGPPGTGKTSTARALAKELGMDVYYLPLSDLTKDHNLLQLLSQVPPRAMLLLEDVDVAHAATERDDERGGVTMAGLLNGLDGMITPHGLITVMTTNHRDRLDGALLRPGRVDHEMEMGPLDLPSAMRLAELVSGQALRDGAAEGMDVHPWPAVTPAELLGAMLPHVDAPLAAQGAAVSALVQASLKAHRAPPRDPAGIEPTGAEQRLLLHGIKPDGSGYDLD